MGRENHASFLERLKLKVSRKDLTRIDLAYRLAKYGHRNQQRDNGERYFEHIRAVALILIDELGIYDPLMIKAALLHDLLEDAYLLYKEDVETIFDEELADMVDALSMPPMGPEFSSKEERLIIYHGTIANSPVRTIIIKLCDRLHNTRTLGNCKREKINRKSRETTDHYIPLIDKIAIEYPEVADILRREFTTALNHLAALQ